MVRGLRKYLTPFAPDQSGAVSILYELGGMVVILDAGGCTGNICGFDEPRWSSERSAIFSAGLRDMDAIMGRDWALVEKIADAQTKLEAKFIALIGTPVPAVIGTDYQALRRMLQKRVEVPVLCIDTNGMKSFEYGAEKAYLALLSAFAFPACAEAEKAAEAEKEALISSGNQEADNVGASDSRTVPGRIGVFGTFPMTETDPQEREWIREGISEALGKGKLLSDVCGTPAAEKNPALRFYGHGAGLEDYRRVSENALNLVSSVSGLAAAKVLKKRFGTDYQVMHPAARVLLQKAWKQLLQEKKETTAADISARFGNGPLRALIVQEQVLGNSLRKELRKLSVQSGQSSEPEIHVMSFFKMQPEWMEAGDRFLTEEAELWALLNPEKSGVQKKAEAWSREQMGEAALTAAQPRRAAYDLILGDAVLKKMLPPDFGGCFLEIPEPAVSGFPAEPTEGKQQE